MAKIKTGNYNHNFYMVKKSFDLITWNDKNFIMKKIQRYVVAWYNTHLLHSVLYITEVI